MKTFLSPIFAMALAAIFMQNSAIASNQHNLGQNIFVFHKKLAEKGSKLSQYKLATMYELGLGTKPDLEQALHWYTISSEKGHSAAADRLTYLQIKRDGYSTTKYGNWLDELRRKVQNNDAESIFLLGQLYQQGIGVDKNPNQAILLLKKAGTMGLIEADIQVEIIEQELATRKKKIVKKTKAITQTSKPAKIPKANRAKQNLNEEKRRRYQAAMNKIKLEQQLLEDQQKWAESQ
ncbi:MAG: tetratricopeptide repeat protein [Gammaproteobacteria bacterium]